MTASSHQSGSVAKRAAWSAPSFTEDAIADVTLIQTNSPGDDGLDQFVGYETTGNS